MTNQKALPNIVKMRAERILKAPAKAAYRLEESNANLLKIVMLDNKVRYVDIREGREVKSAELKVTIVDNDKGKKENTAMISRQSVEGSLTSEKTSAKPKQKSTTKKTVTKKKQTKK